MIQDINVSKSPSIGIEVRNGAQFLFPYLREMGTQSPPIPFTHTPYFIQYKDLADQWSRGVQVFSPAWTQLIFPKDPKDETRNLFTGSFELMSPIIGYRSESTLYASDSDEMKQPDRPSLSVSLSRGCAGTFQTNVSCYRIQKGVRFFPIILFNSFECEILLLQVHITYKTGTDEDPHVVTKLDLSKRFPVPARSP